MSRQPAAHLRNGGELGKGDLLRVHLHNPSRELAFQISFGVHDGNLEPK